MAWQYKNSSTKRDLEINLSWGRSASHRYTLLSTIQGQWKVQKFEGTQQSTDCSHRLSFTLGGGGNCLLIVPPKPVKEAIRYPTPMAYTSGFNFAPKHHFVIPLGTSYFQYISKSVNFEMSFWYVIFFQKTNKKM